MANNKRIVIITVMSSIFFAAYAAKEVGCKCMNKTVQFPSCDICGSESGKMEQAGINIACYCNDDLKLKETSCEEICAENGGWTGEFADQ